jgi:hypothetical protein
LVLFLGCLGIVAPLYAGPLPLFLCGLLLIVCGILEMLETFRAPDAPSLRSTYLSGALSILAGVLLLSTPDNHAPLRQLMPSIAKLSRHRGRRSLVVGFLQKKVEHFRLAQGATLRARFRDRPWLGHI